MGKHWRVLVAFFGIAIIQGVLLSETFYRRLDLNLEARLRGASINPFELPEQITPFQDNVYITCLCLALFAWSWTSGFVLGYLSRQLAWTNWLLFYVVVLDWYWTYRLLKGDVVISDDIPTWRLTLDMMIPYYNLGLLLLFMPAGLWGLSQSLRPDAIRRRLPLRLAFAALVLSSLILWMEPWYNGSSHRPPKLWLIVLLTCPAAYIIFASLEESWEKRLSHIVN